MSSPAFLALLNEIFTHFDSLNKLVSFFNVTSKSPMPRLTPHQSLIFVKISAFTE